MKTTRIDAKLALAFPFMKPLLTKTLIILLLVAGPEFVNLPRINCLERMGFPK